MTTEARTRSVVFAAEFRQYFENFGRVVSAEVMFNRETHKSRGFGFVVFEDEASVDNVLQTAQHSIDGKMVSRCTTASRQLHPRDIACLRLPGFVC